MCRCLLGVGGCVSLSLWGLCFLFHLLHLHNLRRCLFRCRCFVGGVLLFVSFGGLQTPQQHPIKESTLRFSCFVYVICVFIYLSFIVSCFVGGLWGFGGVSFVSMFIVICLQITTYMKPPSPNKRNNDVNKNANLQNP